MTEIPSGYHPGEHVGMLAFSNTEELLIPDDETSQKLANESEDTKKALACRTAIHLTMLELEMKNIIYPIIKGSERDGPTLEETIQGYEKGLEIIGFTKEQAMALIKLD